MRSNLVNYSALRKSMGMRPDQGGIRVRGLKPSAPESQLLKPSDVVLSFDGINIASDGTVPFRHGERIDFSYLVSQKYIGDNALVKVLRDFETLEFNIKLAKHKELIPSHIEGKPPFYIIAEFVFTVLSLPYMRSETSLGTHLHVMAQSIDEQPVVVQSVDKQIVVLSQVLAANSNNGYEDFVNKQVLAFNDVPMENLKSLASMVENCIGEYLIAWEAELKLDWIHCDLGGILYRDLRKKEKAMADNEAVQPLKPSDQIQMAPLLPSSISNEV